MKQVQRDAEPFLDPGIYRILCTSISIFDSAVTLLGSPPPGGVTMPGPAHIACVRAMLEALGIGDEEPFLFS